MLFVDLALGINGPQILTEPKKPHSRSPGPVMAQLWCLVSHLTLLFGSAGWQAQPLSLPLFQQNSSQTISKKSTLLIHHRLSRHFNRYLFCQQKQPSSFTLYPFHNKLQTTKHTLNVSPASPRNPSQSIPSLDYCLLSLLGLPTPTPIPNTLLRAVSSPFLFDTLSIPPSDALHQTRSHHQTILLQTINC